MGAEIPVTPAFSRVMLRPGGRTRLEIERSAAAALHRVVFGRVSTGRSVGRPDGHDAPLGRGRAQPLGHEVDRLDRVALGSRLVADAGEVIRLVRERRERTGRVDHLALAIPVVRDQAVERGLRRGPREAFEPVAGAAGEFGAVARTAGHVEVNAAVLALDVDELAPETGAVDGNASLCDRAGDLTKPGLI